MQTQAAGGSTRPVNVGVKFTLVPPALARCSLALSIVGALASTAVHAQGRAATLKQLTHKAWTSRDGAPDGVTSLAQTADGTLWIGTATGLYRFDGIRFERFEPPAEQPMPSHGISMLHAVPDGALWIGYITGGASVLAGDSLVSYSTRDGMLTGTLTSFALDSVGTIWAATSRGLARLVAGRWRPAGEAEGFPAGMTPELVVDRRGALWAANTAGVYVLPRGGHRFTRWAPSLIVGEADAGSGAVRAAPDGTVWGTSMLRGLVPLTDSAGRPPPPNARGYRDRGWQSAFIDRRGNAWSIYTAGRIVRVPIGVTGGGVPRAAIEAAEALTLSPEAGMSGGFPSAILEDREGTVWVGTEGGLDQFRLPKFTPLRWSSPIAWSTIAAGDGGALWVARALLPLLHVTDSIVARGPADITALHRDLDGGVWLGGRPGLWRSRGDTLTTIALPREARGRNLYAIARERGGALWLVVEREGVFRQRSGVWERFVPRHGLDADVPLYAVSDSAGRTWLGYTPDRLARVMGDTVRIFTAVDGLSVGSITAILVRRDRVWVGGESGVVYSDRAGGDARFRRLVVADGALRGVSGIVETPEGDLWLNGSDGVTRVPAAEIQRALGNQDYHARVERFDTRDGLQGSAPPLGLLPSVVQGTDGRLWFTSARGVAYAHPRRIRRNTLPPPVYVKTLDAGGRHYPIARGRVILPQRTRGLTIGYTAVSLAVPERVRFRYRLLGAGVGADTAWQDAGTRRQAIYTNLGPGAYHFEVIAANDDGVWSRHGASLDVVLPPSFVQTSGFLALCVVAVTGAVWWLAAWRQRRAAEVIRARFDITLAERVRLARDLHDTLLSGLAGISMRLDAVATRATSSSGVDVAALDELREQARNTLVDSRQAVVGMRASGDALIPLPAQLADAARRIFAPTEVAARVLPSGTPCRYPEAVEEQVLRVATEAMTNARKHAHCRTVTISCAYARRELRIRVRDDGRGFDPAQVDATAQLGLVGMRERAAAVGARLTVVSTLGSGTSVVVVVPRSSSR